MNLELETQKVNVRIRINILKILCSNFQAKLATLTSAQICPKMDFEVESSKIQAQIHEPT